VELGNERGHSKRAAPGGLALVAVTEEPPSSASPSGRAVCSTIASLARPAPGPAVGLILSGIVAQGSRPVEAGGIRPSRGGEPVVVPEAWIAQKRVGGIDTLPDLVVI